MLLVLPYSIESPPAAGPVSRARPYATAALIAVNAVVFLAMLPLGEEGREIVYFRHGFVPDEAGRLYTWVTCMFLHGGWLHVIVNMYFLWMFGRLVEERLGPARYLAFYLAAGLAACAAHMATTSGFFSDVPCVGASGAVSGILGAFAVIAARAKVKCFYAYVLVLRPLWGTVTVPSVVFLGIWFLAQLIYAASVVETTTAVQVGYWAHIGGFAFGAALPGARAFASGARRLLREQGRRGLFRRAMRAWARHDLDSAAEMLEGMRGAAAGGGLSGPVAAEDVDLSLARVYLEQGDEEKAVRLGSSVLRGALRRDPPRGGDRSGRSRPRSSSQGSQGEDGKAAPGPAGAERRALVTEAYLLLAASGRTPAFGPHGALAVARGLTELGRDDEAADVLVDALARAPADGRGGPSPEHADSVLYELAQMSRRRGRTGREAEILDLLTRLFPDSPLSVSARWSESPSQG